ncbi:MAG: hypothetical protein OXG30_13320, partial [bacterium]|nr:hypothetical protein [bacterium]
VQMIGVAGTATIVGMTGVAVAAETAGTGTALPKRLPSRKTSKLSCAMNSAIWVPAGARIVEEGVAAATGIEHHANPALYFAIQAR